MKEKEFVKGVINLNIDTYSFNHIFKTSDMSSNATNEKILSEHTDTNVLLKKNVSIFKEALEKNEVLKNSWRQVVGESEILYVSIKADYYVVYVDEENRDLKLSIFWKSDKNLEEIISIASKILKNLFKEIKSKKKIRSIKMIKEMITNDSNLKFYPFFKNSFKRDTSVDISNFKTKIKVGQFLDFKQIITYILIIFGNLIMYVSIPIINISSVLTSSVSLAVYMIVSYLFKDKLQIDISVSSLTFNEDLEETYKMVENEKTKELTEMSLSTEEDN